MKQATTRRTVLRLLAGAPLLLAGSSGGAAADVPKIRRLMQEAQGLAKISQRIGLISRGLIGARYQAYTLIGGAKRPEELVVRDDAFDCVTFCEVVLAAAVARDLDAFAPTLQRIRYRHGKVDWRERNHYFADWCRRSVENKICRPIVLGEPIKLNKVVNSEPAVGERQWTLEAMHGSTLLANGGQFMSGDIVGFVSRRSNLDYFHTGFIAFGSRGELLLRHASGSHRRVLDENMEKFLAVNGTQHVTVLRPEETPAARGLSKAPG